MRGMGKLAGRAAVKHHALDRGGRQDRALLRRKTLEAGGEQRLDRGGHGQLGEIRGGDPSVGLAREQPVVDEHRRELLGEERVAFGRAGDHRRRGRRQGRMVEQVRDQLAALRVAERVEQDRLRVGLVLLQPGRVSSSSGRAMHTSRIGKPREKSATCSIRSRKVGSAQ